MITVKSPLYHSLCEHDNACYAIITEVEYKSGAVPAKDNHTSP